MGWRRESIRSGSQHKSVRVNVSLYMFRSYSTFIYYSINSTFGVGYGMGSVQGIAYRDTVTIGDATGNNQFIGAANQTTRFNTVRPIDGIRTSLSHFYFILFKKRLNLQI